MPLLTSAFADHKPSLVPGSPMTPGHLQISPRSFLAIDPGQRGPSVGLALSRQEFKAFAGVGSPVPAAEIRGAGARLGLPVTTGPSR